VPKLNINSLSSFWLYPIVLGLLCLVQLQNSYAGNWNDFQNLIGNQDALLVADSQGKVLFSKNEDRLLVPASTLKILTALVALQYLGPDYRFPTEFSLDEDNNLVVKGFGDPLLVSEALAEIAGVLAVRLDAPKKEVNDLVLDDSYFDDPIVIPGIIPSYEPYDAPNGALCVNFNTVNFKRNKNGNYVSAEPQTPLLPSVLCRIRASRLDHGRIILPAVDKQITLYSGHLLLYFMKQHGIQASGRVRVGRMQQDRDKLIAKYMSTFSMAQIISKLLEHSNNFIANQLLVAAGAKVYGPPGTLAKGVRAASVYARNVLNIDSIKIVEGSGISRNNLISAQSLHIILEAFAPYHHLMVRSGRSFYKTGTLSNINTRAGYIENGDGGLYRFVLLINTPGKSADGIMNRVLKNLDK